jgi:hypothetical protein
MVQILGAKIHTTRTEPRLLGCRRSRSCFILQSALLVSVLQADASRILAESLDPTQLLPTSTLSLYTVSQEPIGLA